jgi:hypothetical protein
LEAVGDVPTMPPSVAVCRPVSARPFGRGRGFRPCRRLQRGFAPILDSSQPAEPRRLLRMPTITKLRQM